MMSFVKCIKCNNVISFQTNYMKTEALLCPKCNTTICFNASGQQTTFDNPIESRVYSNEPDESGRIGYFIRCAQCGKVYFDTFSKMGCVAKKCMYCQTLLVFELYGLMTSIKRPKMSEIFSSLPNNDGFSYYLLKCDRCGDYICDKTAEKGVRRIICENCKRKGEYYAKQQDSSYSKPILLCDKVTNHYGVDMGWDKSYEKPSQENFCQFVRPDKEKKYRSLFFSCFSSDDNIQFYLNEELIGSFNSEKTTVERNVSPEMNKIVMKYGLGHKKNGYISIPADHNDYLIVGGKPGQLVTKLCILPINVFSDYLDHVYSDIMNSKLKRWVNMHRHNDHCQIVLYYDYFEFIYQTSDNYGYTKTKRVEVKLSSQTVKVLKSIPINRREWGEKGFLLCIRKIIYDRLKRDFKIKIDASGFLNDGI